MASYQYNNALLAPFLALPQGDKVQAECTSIFSFFSSFTLLLIHPRRRLGRR